jgi:hypothetical protein
VIDGSGGTGLLCALAAPKQTLCVIVCRYGEVMMIVATPNSIVVAAAAVVHGPGIAPE